MPAASVPPRGTVRKNFDSQGNKQGPPASQTKYPGSAKASRNRATVRLKAPSLPSMNPR